MYARGNESGMMERFKTYEQAKEAILAEILNNLRIHVAMSYLNKAKKDLGQDAYDRLMEELNPILGLKK